jgi:hypothetical protein
MNLQEQFYRVMINSRLRSSRAASTSNARVPEMINGLLVSKPAKPEIIDIQEYAKSGRAAASVPGINKLKAIRDFIRSNGRIRLKITERKLRGFEF